MFISREAIKKILNIKGDICIDLPEMVKKIEITFFPYIPSKISKELIEFFEELKSAFKKLGIRIVPYNEILIKLPLKKLVRIFFTAMVNTFVKKLEKLIGAGDEKNKVTLDIFFQMKKRRKVKRGVSIITLGEGNTGNLPVDYLMGFRDNSIVTIIDIPVGIGYETDFETHFNTAVNLFAYHMTNIIIGVDNEKWIFYNLDGAHPIYPRKDNLESYILKILVPRLAASIQPPRLSEFITQEESFNPNDNLHKSLVQDLIEGGITLDKIGLFPQRKLIKELPFRNDFYKWVGQIHLDTRAGMSYGFLARQLPVKLPSLLTAEAIQKELGNKFFIDNNKDFFIINKSLFLKIQLLSKISYYLKVPEVWVLTQRSGSDKTRLDPQKDLIKIGLSQGRMILQTPLGLKLQPGYRPSYDTRVILAHAIGNVIVGAILLQFYPNNLFSKWLQSTGMALAHWHGYFNKAFIPSGWHIHGGDNPHVSCSTPQAAMYALEGKIKVFMECLRLNKKYLGDIHIEPHHGTNITYPSLRELGVFLTSHPKATELGNRYLANYKKL